MSVPKYSTEHSARIYNNDHGYYVEAGFDRDGLDMCEIRYSQSDEEKDSKVNFPPMPWPMAVKLAEAIIQIAKLQEPSDA
jgi:hypothetical protein